MASFTAGTTFTDGVANDVTAAKLGALVTNATPTSGFIQDRTAETVTATNDTLLIGDASDSNNLKRITVANFAQTLPTANITTGTIGTGTFGTTTSTAATITTGTIPTLVATTLVKTGTGSAAAPAIVPTGDTNTGIFFPAADTIAFSEGGTESMRIDSSGNVGIGVVTPISSLHIKNATPVSKITLEDSSTNRIGQIAGGSDGSGGYLAFSAGNNGGSIYERLRIDSSGNVGIGTTSPQNILHISSSGPVIRIQDNDTVGNGTNSIATWFSFRDSAGSQTGYFGFPSDPNFHIWNQTNSAMVFGTNHIERLRITSGGDVLVGRASSSGYGKLQVETSVSSDWSQYNTNSATTEPRGIRIRHSVATPNNTSAYFIWCEDATRERFYVTSNGGVYNFSANNANLSDERLKKDIQPSPSYLSKICSIPVVNFKFKDQTHNDYNLGVIAQQVEAVCPELVDVDGFGETPEDGVPLKAIYQTDLQYALMKCVQELKAENDSLKARITALEAA